MTMPLGRHGVVRQILHDPAEDLFDSCQSHQALCNPMPFAAIEASYNPRDAANSV